MTQEVTADQIRQLRERTGVGMAKCKEALVLASGEMEKAIDILRKAGIASAVKKEGRETKEGLILTGENQKLIVIAEANAETDFVTQNDRFKQFLQDCIEQSLQTEPKSLEVLLEQPYEKDRSLTIEQYRNLVMQALGENIQLKRVELIHKHAGSSYGIYAHLGGKLVVIVEISGATGQEALAKEIAMHAAAESPDYLKAEEIPSHVIAREEEVSRAQVEGKPAQVADKIIAGKLKAYQEQVCLLHQKYIKDNSVTVEQFLASHAKQLGQPLSIQAFWRWKVGQ